MTNNEFDVLDELYFVQSFEFLQENCEMEDVDLVNTLISLWEKGWIKILTELDEEEKADQVDIKRHHQRYFYLANKKGLMAHNTLN